MAKIVVIGSANMDTTYYLKSEFPERYTGEDINEVESTSRFLGGKGANQAVATKMQLKGENDVFFIGCVGKDEQGLKIIEEFKRKGINYSGMEVLEGLQTDGRIISVDKKGENRMMGYGECIKRLTPEVIRNKESILEDADIIAIQMKMPVETVKWVIEYCEKHNKKLLIDPTPQEKSKILTENGMELLKKATYLTPNEEEAFALLQYAKGNTLDDAKRIFNEISKEERLRLIEGFVSKYPNVIATIGENGVIYSNNGVTIRKATYPTKCKDSTGAGDTFNGAFIAALERNENFENAIDYALMTSSIKVRYQGAQNGVPTYEETTKALAKVRDLKQR